MSTVRENNLFMSVKPPSKDVGLMNLGKHCHKCSELDFLPFHCEFCNHTYCSKHRTLDLHGCVRPSSPVGNSDYSGPTAASLFPDRAKHQQMLDDLLKAPTATTIAGLLGVGDSKNALTKLTKFLHIQRTKRQKRSFFLKKTPNKVVELASIKKVARGGPVPEADRVYLWVLFVDRNEDDMDKIDAEKERRGVWVSKNWSVGRALDSLADVLGIMNYNNSTQQTSERLNLFKLEKNEPKVLETSKKVGLALTNGDMVYLVRGSN